MSFLKIKQKILSIYAATGVFITLSCSAFGAAGDPFAKASDSTNALIDGLKTWVPAIATLMVMGVGIAFIFGKMPKVWAACIAGGCIIIGSASAIVGMFYS